MQQYKLKDGRICQNLAWFAQTPQPWKSGYARVMIPLTEKEQVNSTKKCHVQIVSIKNLEVLK